MTVNTLRQFSPFCRQSHNKRAAICFADCARYQPARCQTIENAGQGRSLVRKAAVESATLAERELASSPKICASPCVNPRSRRSSR